MRSNERFCYDSTVSVTPVTGPETSVCALPGCVATVVQPAGGGRRRLYCSNAHRAEARRRRIADSPEPAPGELLGPALERLGGILSELRSYEAALRSIDPGRQAVETARVRAEATAEVLAAQQAAAKAAEEAASSSERLVAERAQWERERSGYEAGLEELRTALTAARERAASAQDTLDDTLLAHRADVDERDQRAARAAAAHEEEASRLLGELDQARTAVATARAQAEAADHRASRAENASRAATDRAAEMEASMNRLRVDAAKAQAAIEAAMLRTEAAERLLDQAREELQAERSRHDLSLSQLHEQLAQLVARTPARRSAAKAPARKRTTPAT